MVLFLEKSNLPLGGKLITFGPFFSKRASGPCSRGLITNTDIELPFLPDRYTMQVQH